MSELLTVDKSPSPRLRWAEKVKKDLSIFTHHCNGLGWMAFSQTKAIELLEGYSLSDDQKNNPELLFAGYCRLLDESGQIADGEKTEFDAIVTVAIKHGARLWNEQDYKTT